MTLVDTLRQRIRVNKMTEKLIKEAEISPAANAFLYTMGGGLASAGVAFGVPAAIEAVQGARIRSSKEKLINKMKAAHPELRNFSKKDMDLVFNSLSMHAPKVLKDPLVGGQVMLEALRRGNHMDIGQLGNVSKMTGGSGISEHQRDAANMLAQQMGRGSENYAKTRYDSRVTDQVKVERIKGDEMRKTETYKGRLKARDELSAVRGKFKAPQGSEELYGARAKYRAYRKNKKA